MKISINKIKWIRIIISITIILLITFFLKGKTFVPENLIINSFYFEVPTSSVFFSCQFDCSIGDGIFHEECVGFNGCKDSNFLRNKNYCESDSDCVSDFGCCTKPCEGEECVDALFCSVSNKEYTDAHSFSCINNIQCIKTSKCILSNKTKCLNNICRIIV